MKRMNLLLLLSFLSWSSEAKRRNDGFGSRLRTRRRRGSLFNQGGNTETGSTTTDTNDNNEYICPSTLQNNEMSIEEVTRASVAAQYSELIYEMDKADDDTSSSSGSGIFFESGVDAVYVTQYENKYCMVVFRGTEPDSIEDWITNIDLDAVNLFNSTTTCKVHQGYYNAYYNFEYRDQIEEFLQSCQAECTDCDVVLTGHSQGGAIAGIAGILLQSEYNPFVITFGGTF